MKKSLLLALAFIECTSLSAQTEAMDWTRIECGTSNEHHLFAELDSGYVIMIDFVMMNCAPCVTATNSLRGIYNAFMASHPGKVRLYSVGFNNFTTCEQMTAWRIGYHFTHPVFEKGADETIYYGGIGMPTIIVLGGNSAHKVYYNHFGYDSSEDQRISTAIEQALAESTLIAVRDPSNDIAQISVFPNPFAGELSVELSGQTMTHLLITDVYGIERYRQEVAPGDLSQRVHINASGLPSGILFLAGYNGSRLLGIQKVRRE